MPLNCEINKRSRIGIKLINLLSIVLFNFSEEFRIYALAPATIIIGMRKTTTYIPTEFVSPFSI